MQSAKLRAASVTLTVVFFKKSDYRIWALCQTKLDAKQRHTAFLKLAGKITVLNQILNAVYGNWQGKNAAKSKRRYARIG